MNFERICYGCFQEKPDGAASCPYCGFQGEEQPFPSLPLGTLLNGRYMTGKVLGIGGSDITYLGYDLATEKKVIVKEYMPSSLATRDADRYNVTLAGAGQEEYQNGMERFMEEARFPSQPQSMPDVGAMQDSFKENQTAYCVMEYKEIASQKEKAVSQGANPSGAQAFSYGQTGNGQTSSQDRTAAMPSGQAAAPSGQATTGYSAAQGIQGNQGTPVTPAAPGSQGNQGTQAAPGKPRKKRSARQIMIIILLVLGIIGSISKIVRGISTLFGGGDVAAVTDVTTEEPEGVDKVKTWDYSDEDYLNISMEVPDGYEQSDVDSSYAIFASEDGRGELLVGYNVDEPFVIYSLSDVENNVDKLIRCNIDALITPKSEEYEIISQGYREVGSANAYWIQYSTTREDDVELEFLTVLVESQNGYGCYEIDCIYTAEDGKEQAKMFAAIDSLQINGPVNSIWNHFTDEQLPFEFLYWEDDKTEISFEVVNEGRLKATMVYETTEAAMEVQCAPLSDGLTKETLLEYVGDGLVSSSGFKKVEGKQNMEIERGVHTWLVDRYSFEADGETYYMDCMATEHDGYVLVILGGGATEEDLDNEETIMKVSSTIRIVK